VCFDQPLRGKGQHEVKQYLERRLIGPRPTHFPANTLSVAALRGYLHNLDATGFKPDIVLLDYLGLMDIDTDTYRISLGRLVGDLCALAAERDLAIVTAEQSNREGATRLSKTGDMVILRDKQPKVYRWLENVCRRTWEQV
jgi:hypothetical protein